MNDDFAFPDLSDFDDTDPTAQGIVRCLRMLADEAAALHLGRTLAALQTAMLVCADEAETGEPPTFGELGIQLVRLPLLH